MGNIHIDPSKEMNNLPIPIVSPSGKAGELMISVSQTYLDPEKKNEILGEYFEYDVQGQVHLLSLSFEYPNSSSLIGY